MANYFVASVKHSYCIHAGKKECKLPGCHSKCYITNDGFVYDFCGQSHAVLYERQFAQGKKWLLHVEY